MNGNLIVLTLSQIFSFTAAPVTVFLSGIIGSQISPLKSLSTLPMSISVVGIAIGAIFGAMGETTSLGFVEETEKQVVKHLEKHLEKISQEDKKTIKILETMRADEDQHANEASESGGEELKDYTKKFMSMTAKVMTSTSAHI